MGRLFFGWRALMDLPNYAWHLIADYLEISSVCCLSATCKTLREAFLSENFWRARCHRDYGQDPSFVFFLDRPSRDQYAEFTLCRPDDSVRYPFVCRVAVCIEEGAGMSFDEL